MTLQELSIWALRDLTYLGSGETPSADELADCLAHANSAIDSWNANPAAQPKAIIGVFPLTVSPTYTLGPGGTWSQTSVPLVITGASATNVGGVQKPVKVCASADEFGALAEQRSITANWPAAIYCDYAYPTATVHVGPLSSGSIYLSQLVPEFAMYAAITDVLSLPPGYTNLLRGEIAMRFAGSTGRAVPETVAAAFAEAKQVIGARNTARRSGAPAAPATPAQ